MTRKAILVVAPLVAAGSLAVAAGPAGAASPDTHEVCIAWVASHFNELGGRGAGGRFIAVAASEYRVIGTFASQGCPDS